MRWLGYVYAVVAFAISIAVVFGVMFLGDAAGLDPWLRDWLALLIWALVLGLMAKAFGRSH